MKRRTRQRAAIENVVVQARRPLGPQEILERAQQTIASLSIATVYRAIRAMLEERVIVAVDIPGHAPYYEKAGMKHHHHFVCTACGRVYEMEGCAYSAEGMAPRGFQVEGHEIILYGRCRPCGTEPGNEDQDTESDTTLGIRT